MNDYIELDSLKKYRCEKISSHLYS